MKHLKLATICLVLALTVMVVTDVEAGRIKKPPKGARTEKTEEMNRPAEFNNYPNMQFTSGVLSRDAIAGWKIGDIPLYVHKDCSIYLEGAEEGYLEEGREAIVMGSMIGDAINAMSIRIDNPSYQTNRTDDLESNREPGENPNCGRFTELVD
jgi:hypothetical protein